MADESTTPLRRGRYPSVEDWMDQYAPDQHAVFNVNSFQNQRASASRRQQKSVDDLTADFCNVVQQYEHTLSKQDPRARINIRSAHSWDEVVRAAKDAEKAYNAEAKRGATGHVRGYFRHIGDYSTSAAPWVGLLPNDKYFSVLCGGLKLVLGVAAKRSERRKMILDAFDNLPAAILKTQRCHEVFPNNPMLRDKALAVYIDLLTMTEEMISCLVDKKILARIKDGLKGPLSDNSLDDKLSRYHKSMAALEEQVQYLHISASATANASIAQMLPSLESTATTTMDTNKIARSIEQRTSILATHAEGIATEIDSLRSDMSFQTSVAQSMSRRLDANTQAVAHLSSLLHGVLEFAEWRESQYRTAIVSSDFATQRRQQQAQLQQYLNIDLGTADKDLDFMLRQAQSCDTQGQSAMHWVLQSSRFKYWVQSRNSDVLVVDGNLGDGTARYSSMSLLSGMLVQSLRPREPAQVLHFFCGAHNSKSDPVGGPSGLVRSLIVQLLSLQVFDLNFVNSSYWKEGLRTHDLLTLGRLFHRLLEQLTGTIVFCIIDSVSVFETNPWLGELRSILQTLLDTAADQALDVRFKLLATSTTRSRGWGDMLDHRYKLTVPADAGATRLVTSRTLELEMTRDENRQPAMSLHGSSSEDVYAQGYE